MTKLPRRKKRKKRRRRKEGKKRRGGNEKVVEIISLSKTILPHRIVKNMKL